MNNHHTITLIWILRTNKDNHQKKHIYTDTKTVKVIFNMKIIKRKMISSKLYLMMKSKII